MTKIQVLQKVFTATNVFFIEFSDFICELLVETGEVETDPELIVGGQHWVFECLEHESSFIDSAHILEHLREFDDAKNQWKDAAEVRECVIIAATFAYKNAVVSRIENILCDVNHHVEHLDGNITKQQAELAIRESLA